MFMLVTRLLGSMIKQIIAIKFVLYTWADLPAGECRFLSELLLLLPLELLG